MHYLRFALRSVVKTPLVSGVAILSLALGIGANAAIFSVFERMVLRPLPVQEPERLVNLIDPGPKSGSMSSNNAGGPDAIFSYPMFRDLEREAGSFTGIAGHRAFGANLAAAGDTLSGEGMLVSGSYFEILGLNPALGRLFSTDDDQVPGGHPVVVLSHAYWQSRFNADPEVLNQPLTVNGHPLTIVGVAPRGFFGTTLGEQPEVFVPITMRGAMSPGWDGFENRRSYWVYLFGRLKPGVSLEEAEAAINGPFRAIVQGVEAAQQEGSSERFLAGFREKEIVLEPGGRGQSDLHAEVSTPLLLLLGVTGLVLLIACANVANLLLTKATARASEIAIRLSLGARRRQLVTQLLSESFLLALAGCVLGLLVARWTLELFTTVLSSDGPGFALELRPATWLLLGVLCLVTSLVGLFPALHCTQKGLVISLRSQSGQTVGSRAASRFRSSMAALQIALSVALLIAAGLFTRSLLNVSRVELGIDVGHLATFGLSPELNGLSPAESQALFERVEDALEPLPGVTLVAASMVPLIAGDNWGTNVSVQGFAGGPDVDTHANYNEVGPGYLRTLGTPLISGREFDRGDALGAPKVAIVNEAFARKFNLGRDAVGKRMQVGAGGELDIEIVGLAQDSKYSQVKGVVPPLFLLPYRQDEELGSINFYLRTSGEPASVLAAVRQVISTLEPNLPIEGLRSMKHQVQESLALDRILSTLSASFAALATLLAAIGLYGVVAYAVAQRTREIGLRMALGADAHRVRWLILRQVSWMAVPGALLGVVVALGIGRLAQSLLFELGGHDPAVFVSAVAVLAVVAVGAGLPPARRASRIDPLEALREE